MNKEKHIYKQPVFEIIDFEDDIVTASQCDADTCGEDMICPTNFTYDCTFLS